MTETAEQGNSNTTTDMEKELSQQPQQQLTLQSDRIIKEDTGYIDDQVPQLPRLTNDMNAAKMSSEDLMKMPLVTETVQWTTTQTRNTVIVQFDLPKIFNDLDLYHKRILELYNFTNFTLKMDFFVNVSSFHSGRLIAWFDPMDISKTPPIDNVTVRDLNVYRASMQPHVQLDSGTNNSGTLSIPWEHFLSYINMNNDIGESFQNGTVYVMVLNPLFAPENAASELSLTVTISCHDINLDVPVRPHRLQFAPALPAVANMSGIANTLTGALADIKTGNVGGLLKTGKSLIGSLLDKPTEPDNKTQNCLATTGPLCYTDGVDSSIPLDNDPRGQYSQNYFSMAPSMETNIQEILQKKCLFDIVTWNQTDVVNTEIAVYKVRPGLYGSNRVALPPPNLTYFRETPTYLSYFEKAFRFWSGGIVFRFNFASSQFHTGKLQISFEPTITPAPFGGDAVQDFSQCPSIIFDLHESKTIVFHVPYVADRPSLYTSNLETTNDDEYGNAHCLGTLRIKVLNMLVGNGSVSPSIEMNAYVAATPDFEFDCLAIGSRQALLAQDVTLPPALEAVANMDTDSTKTRAEDKEIGFSIVKGNAERQERNRFGQRVTDVREACRRFGLLGEDAILPTQFDYYKPGGTGTPQFSAGLKSYYVGTYNPTEGRQVFSYIPYFYFSQLYIMKSGACRYKFVPYVTRNLAILWRALYGIGSIQSASLAPDGSYDINESYPQIIQNTTQDSGIEVETRYFSMFNQHLVTQDPNITGSLLYSPYSSGTLSLVAKTWDTDLLPKDSANRTYIPYSVYIAAGNDFALRWLVSPPDIYQNL